MAFPGEDFTHADRKATAQYMTLRVYFGRCPRCPFEAERHAFRKPADAKVASVADLSLHLRYEHGLRMTRNRSDRAARTELLPID